MLENKKKNKNVYEKEQKEEEVCSENMLVQHDTTLFWN